MRSGPIKCLACSVQYWQTLAGCMPWECFSQRVLKLNEACRKHPQSAFLNFFNWPQLQYRQCVLSYLHNRVCQEEENVATCPNMSHISPE